MSDHHHHHETQKHRKLREQREKNRKNWLLFMASDQARIRVTIGAPAIANRHGEAKKEKKVWSQQLSSIRNRLDNSKRLSEDRFNRFAGTSDGGGMGR